MSNSIYNNVREIIPNDSHKSFYGKAWEFTDYNGDTVLVSYQIRVARITSEGKYVVNGLYSATTTRHIKSFLTAHGFDYKDSKDILKRYQA
ncbi:MAG: hypothetical protein IKF91_03155 [Bacilli bacterium]|nr:hypothetical protein [Bacilli bacterium]